MVDVQAEPVRARAQSKCRRHKKYLSQGARTPAAPRCSHSTITMSSPGATLCHTKPLCQVLGLDMQHKKPLLHPDLTGGAENRRGPPPSPGGHPYLKPSFPLAGLCPCPCPAISPPGLGYTASAAQCPPRLGSGFQPPQGPKIPYQSATQPPSGPTPLSAYTQTTPSKCCQARSVSSTEQDCRMPAFLPGCRELAKPRA